MFQRRIVALAAFAVTLIFTGVNLVQADINEMDKQETKCGGQLGKNAEKLNKTYLKEVSKCRDSDIAEKEIGACPNAGNLAKIAKTSSKLDSAVAKHCASTCSLSGIACMGNQYCEPNVNNSGFPAECTAGAKGKFFDLRDLNFPGPLCPPFATAADWSGCVDSLTQNTAAEIINQIYGTVTNLTGISDDAAKCLSGLSKSTQKLVSTIAKGVSKCRTNNNKLLQKPAENASSLINPAQCRFVDTKLASKIAKAEDKLRDAAQKCVSDAVILELDLCGNGIAGTADRTTAGECLITAATELADSQDLPADRALGQASIIEAAYPPVRGVCGDGVANQISNNFAKLGEECDGADDSACPGNCIPPGDLWECTCATEVDGITPKYRHRFIADGLLADLDSGGTGTSHNSGVADGAGYILEIDPGSCDCDAMDDLECVGATGDPICDTSGKLAPFCSWSGIDGISCEAHGGDADFQNDDDDCYICDDFASNAGVWCSDDQDCGGQCYPLAGGAPTIACTQQSDCGADEICRGQCDRTQTCNVIANGAPLPISSGGTAVCILTTFQVDTFGTMNILTGEHETFYEQFSKTHLGVTNEIPCPVCGGFCLGGAREGSRCSGTCDVPALDQSGSGTDCRFDDDCLVGEVCSTATAACPGSECNLSLVCRGGANTGNACRIEAPTTIFGLVSGDCPPDPNKNISGQNGLDIKFLPATSEARSLPLSLPCDAPGFTQYDCPCPTDGGAATKPNRCAFACDAGPEIGVGCGVNAGAINGVPTVCDAGALVGQACDEDADCPGGTCSVNPTHCTGGDIEDENKICATNGDCGGGGVCGDACPSGRCVPLCLGGRNGDLEEGFCAAGPPTFHCSNAEDIFRVCSEAEANAACVNDADLACSNNNTQVCATNGDCSGGGTCMANAPARCVASCENGVGTGGSGDPCAGPGTCGGGEVCCGICKSAGLCEAGSDTILGTSDDVPGAGICVADTRNCFEYIGGETAVGSGKDGLDGPGFGPNSIVSVSSYCIGATSAPSINNTAGLGGPGRLRQPAVNKTNGYTSIP